MENPFRKDHKYFFAGLTALIVIITAIVFTAIILNLRICWNAIRTILSILSPVIYGFAIAYILNPLVRRIERLLLRALHRSKLKPTTCKRLGRAGGVLGAMIVLVAVIYGLFSILLPQLGVSITSIVNNLPGYYDSIMGWLQKNLIDHPELGAYVEDIMKNLYDMLQNWATTSLLGNIQNIMTVLTSSVFSVLNTLLDIVIGVIVAVYILLSKEKFQAQTKKVLVAILRGSRADRVLELGREANTVFGGFIIGKLLDSAIIGVLCYFCMLILRLPYPALIATIVGVTNIIPFFGPFIGAIPSAIIVLLTNPIKGIYFIILALVLQQLDGNIIGPRILGNATGLTSFWVIVAITFFGGLFGFVGMVLGVPVFAMLYMLISEWINRRLKYKRMPTETKTYEKIQTVADLRPARIEKTEENLPVEKKEP